MKIFISSPPIKLLSTFHSLQPDTKINVLLTLYKLKKATEYTKKNRDIIGDIILDCGAFGIHSLDLDEESKEREFERLFQELKAYGPFAQDQYDMVFSMDDRFDLDSFDHNLARLQELEEEGLDAVPVIHNIYDATEVNYYVDNDYKTIAIGQCKGRENLEVLWPVVEKFHKNGVRVHLFGITAPNIISHVPAYSCDSKTWLEYAIHGRALYWNPENPGLDKTDIIYFPKYEGSKPDAGHYLCNEYKYKANFEKYIGDKLQLELNALRGLKADFNRQLVNLLYFVELEETINAQPVVI